MKFVKLTQTEGSVQYINLDLAIRVVYSHTEKQTEIQFAHGAITVKETPEEILELAEGK
jgi:hypothetical protein